MTAPPLIPAALLVTLLALPAGAALSWSVSQEKAHLFARAASVAAFLAALLLLVVQARGQWGGFLALDPLSDLFLFLVTSIHLTSVWYSRGYLSDVHEPFLLPRTYYALLAAFTVAMLFTVSASDLGLLWIGVESTTVASALLIVLERKVASVEAAWRYTLIASAGLAVALLGLVLLYQATGTLNIRTLAEAPPPFSLLVGLVVALSLVGFGTKVGIFPMHAWLPDAHSEAPAPVSALFSGVLLPTALYAFLRVEAIVPQGGPLPLHALVEAFGLTTALVAALLLQEQRSFKRLLAYSSMENMGLALVGIGIGGIGLYAALLLVVAHAYAKSSAFYCAGNVLRATGTNRIAEVRDLRHRMPWTAGLWVLSGLAVTGAPPFGTFLAEVLLVAGALASGSPVVAFLLVIAIAVAFLGVNHQLGGMVFHRPAVPASPVLREPRDSVALPLANLGVALAIGIVSIPYLSPAIRAAAQLLGGLVP